MKISNIPKKKIEIDNTTSSMTLDVSKGGNITVNQDAGKISVVEKKTNIISIKTEKPTFQISESAAKIPVVMIPGLIGPVGPAGKDGQDGIDGGGGSSVNFLPPIAFATENFNYSTVVDGDTVFPGDYVLELSTLELWKYRMNETWHHEKTLSNDDVFQISKGNVYGGKMYKIIDYEIILIKESEINKWEII